MKRTELLLTVPMASSFLSGTALAGTRVQDFSGRYYQDDDGINPTNQWYQEFGGKWYYLDESGYMFTDGTAPDGRVVGVDGVRVQLVSGEPETALREINNWVIGDIWNHGFCDFYHYKYDGTDNTGRSIDIDHALQQFKEPYKRKAGYDAYISALSEDYLSLKTAWSKLSIESDKLYRHFESGVNQIGSNTDTIILVQYRDAFSKYVSDKK